MHEESNNPGQKRFDRIDLIPLAAAVLLAFAVKAYAFETAAPTAPDAPAATASAPR
jgi:hypothetical protein